MHTNTYTSRRRFWNTLLRGGGIHFWRAPRLSAQKERFIYARERRAVCICMLCWMHELFISAPTRPNSLFISKFRWCCALSLAAASAINEKQIHVKCDTLFPRVGSYEISFRSLSYSAVCRVNFCFGKFSYSDSRRCGTRVRGAQEIDFSQLQVSPLLLRHVRNWFHWAEDLF